jgi:Fe-S cluster assembly protein SufD
MVDLSRRDFTNVDRFVSAHEVLPKAAPWLVERRAAALQRLEQHGFPGSRDEDWKYTNARAILGVPYTPALGAHTSIFGRFLDPSAPRLVFVDGQLVDAASRLAGGRVVVSSLRQAAAKGTAEALLGAALGDDPVGFDALNTAFTVDGLFLDVPDGVVVDEALHIVHLHTGDLDEDARRRMAVVRNVIRVGRGSELQLVEHYLGHGEGLTSAVTEIVAADGAQVSHLRIQDEHPTAFHVGTLAARLARDARLRSMSLTFGAAMSRTDIRVALEGPGAGCTLEGMWLLRGSQHADTHTHVDHVAPHTTSSELYKGIVDDTARGVFTGRVVVRRDAQQIDSVQKNHNLLLGERAVANTRPQLEIHADDVKCGHGATVGRIDPEAEFYLRQRGIGAAETRGLLIWAFANELLGHLPEGAVRSGLEQRVWKWLAGEGAAS